MLDWKRPFGRREVAPEAKAAPALALVTSGGRAVWSSRNFEVLAREGFAKNAVVYRCVRMVAEAAASVPLIVLEGGERAGAGHPVQRMLHRPNAEQGGPDLLEAFYGALQTSGNGYLECVGGFDSPTLAAARPSLPTSGEGEAALYALRPERMAVVPGARGWAEAYDYSVGGRVTRIGRDADGWLPVLHLKLFNPVDDHYGFPPLEAAAFAVDVHNASGAWNKALLDNAARPSGALVFGGGQSLTEEQFARLKLELAANHAGTENAGKPLLLEGGLDWKPMSMSPADMDFIAGKHAAAREIALAFGVPPQLLGIPTARGRAIHPAGVGVTLTPLERGPRHRLHGSGRLKLRLEGARPRSRSWAEVAGGANALAVLHGSGEWEMLQFLDAELVGPETYLLSRLLRGQSGTDPAVDFRLAPGASVVLLGGDLVPVEVSSSERGAELLWRATPEGSLDPVSITETRFTWRGLAERPWSPAHLRARRTSSGDLRISWTRRARVEGDAWAGEPPLSEEEERYQVTVAAEGAPPRRWEVDSARAVYRGDQLAEDFPDPATPIEVEVRQGSTSFGWGAPARLVVRL